MRRWLVLALLLASALLLHEVRPAAAILLPPGRCGPGGIFCDPDVCEVRPWACPRRDNRGNRPVIVEEPEEPVCDLPRTGPSLFGFTSEPDYPIVVGQDPQRRGFEFRVRARGGQDECGDLIRLTNIEVEVSLSPASVNWIRTDLAKRYPGAALKGHAVVDRRITLSGATGSVYMHVLPYDPGVWQIQVTVTQADGQQTQRTFSVPVYLLEGTLVEP